MKCVFVSAAQFTLAAHQGSCEVHVCARVLHWRNALLRCLTMQPKMLVSPGSKAGAGQRAGWGLAECWLLFMCHVVHSAPASAASHQEIILKIPQKLVSQDFSVTSWDKCIQLKVHLRMHVLNQWIACQMRGLLRSAHSLLKLCSQGRDAFKSPVQGSVGCPAIVNSRHVKERTPAPARSIFSELQQNTLTSSSLAEKGR